LKGAPVLIRFLLVPLLIALTGLPAFARTTVIAELGTAPLLGTSTSTAQMRARVAGNRAFVEEAVRKLGMSENDYMNFSAAIASSRAQWVTVPRHLDAMTWRSGSHVYVLHDVRIPAGTHGWKVELNSGRENLAVYMPAACGNVSVVRTMARVVAHRPAAPPPIIAAAPEQIVPVAAPPVVVPDDTPPPAAVVATTEFPPVAAVPAHHLLFLAPLLAGVAALAAGSGSGPISTVPVGCP
jgi:hypothetical protein